MDDNAVLISFGPFVDRMFVYALALLIFVYGVTAAMWIYNEFARLFNVPRVRKFFKLKPKPEPESEVHELVSEPVSPVLYEVMWSTELADIYAANTRRRIVRDPREGARDLLNENGDGYIRYRVWLSDTQPWGRATWHEGPRLELPKFSDMDENVVSTQSGKHFIVPQNEAAGFTGKWSDIKTLKAEDDTDN